MIEFQETDLSSAREWDDLVDAFGGTIFHSAAWIGTTTRHHPVNPMHLLIRHGDAVLGVFPLFTRSFGVLRVAASPMVVEDNPYLGPVMDSSVSLSMLLPSLIEYVRQKHFHFLRVLPWVEGEQMGEVVPKKTHLLSLNGEEDDLWRGMTSKCRNHIRKAMKSGVIIDEIRERSDVETYYRLLEELYAAQGMQTPNPLGFFLDIWEIFGRRQVRFLKAVYEGEMIAGAIIVIDGEKGYYLNGTSRKEFNRLAPSNLLQWEAIRLCRSLGVTQYDFVNSDLPRLAKFKESFGGTLKTYGCLEVASSRWVAYLREKYPEYKHKLEKLNTWLPS